ncbi:unnamed protein product, partial [Dovyalis caffra]
WNDGSKPRGCLMISMAASNVVLELGRPRIRLEVHGISIVRSGRETEMETGRKREDRRRHLNPAMAVA